MKLPSSSATTSTSPSSYHLNSDAAAAAGGCLSGILRRIICGTLDMGSSSRSRVADAAAADAALGFAGAEKSGNLQPPAASPAPGIVARLMGLETMPAPPCAPPQGPIGRSRSTGSLEAWPVLLPAPAHRRSHSFRETPTFLREENDEFLLLSFCAEDGEEQEAARPRPQGANHEAGRRELDKKTNRKEDVTQERPRETATAAEKTNRGKEKRKKNVQQREVSREKAAEGCRRHGAPPRKPDAHVMARSRAAGAAKATTHKEMPDRTRALKKRDQKKGLDCSKTMIEPECSSQNGSPVSVLDRLSELDGESLTDTSTPISDAEEEPRTGGSSRRKLSSELDCFDDPSAFFQLILVEEKEGSMSIEEGRGGTGKATSLPHSSSELWAEACRLVDRDVQREPWKTQDSEEIVVEFGLQMLEALLHEVVGEFCHGPSVASHCT